MITLLDEQTPTWFPDPAKTDQQGLVAVSEKLGPERLIHAYQSGIFPWMKMEYSPHFWCWFSPHPRMVLYPSEFKLSDSLKRIIKKNTFEVRVNHGFPQTMRECSTIERPEQESSWIEDDMIDDYSLLHQQGIAHSIEAFLDGERVGGLYGLAMGKVFFGESMFHKVSDASKVCFAFLIELASSYGIKMIDCQVHTPHLASLGAREIPRDQFLSDLKLFLDPLTSVVDWKAIS